MSKFKIFLISIFTLLITYNLQLTTSFAEADIAVVEKPFMEGRYDRAAYEAQRLIDERAGQRHEIYYLKALSELKLNKFNEARQGFEAIISKYPQSSRVFDAYVGIGDAYFLEGNTDKAIKTYSEIKERFPSDKNIALVDSRLNDCHKNIVPAEIPQNEPAPRVSSGPIPSSVEASKGYISVQAGCFKSKRNADALSSRLTAAGYQSHVELPLAAGDRLYRVKVGRFKSRAEAEGLAVKLKRTGYKTKICDENACQ